MTQYFMNLWHVRTNKFSPKLLILYSFTLAQEISYCLNRSLCTYSISVMEEGIEIKYLSVALNMSALIRAHKDKREGATIYEQ